MLRTVGVVRGTRTIRKMGQGGYTWSGYDGIPGLNYFEKGSAQNDKSSVLRERGSALYYRPSLTCSIARCTGLCLGPVTE